MEQGISERKACALIGFSRSSCRYENKEVFTDDPYFISKIYDYAMFFKKMGYRKIHELIVRSGDIINHKRFYRIWNEQNLQLPRKTVRRRKMFTINPRPYPAEQTNDVWCYDFIFDKTVLGETLKMLVVIDEYSRKCLDIFVGYKLNSADVKNVIDRLINVYGKPKYIRSDNGSEFIAKNLREWFATEGITPVYIHPGCPWENGFVESFNGKFRNECLNSELFWSKAETQFVVNKYKHLYNKIRPHMSLGYRTPDEVALYPVEPISLN